ncbi:hypothetical protein HDU97_004467 [Phlyctochytrium planicorne]|nr:hypothetical protein HDU97_004467 [Phlyctochytrium planicorne]
MSELGELFSALLHYDNNIRTQAERALESIDGNDGFLEAVLNVIRSPAIDPMVKRSAIVYFKNRIRKAWTVYDRMKDKVIPIGPHDREVVKRTIMPAMVETQLELKVFGEALRCILSYDFPDSWPTFLDEALVLLNSNETAKLSVALIGLHGLARHVGYVARDEPLANLTLLVKTVFPTLLNIGKALFEHASPESFSLLRMVLKVYLAATRIVLIDELKELSQVVAWGTLFLNVVKHPGPQPAAGTDITKDPVWKAKKRAYSSFYTLIKNYCGKRKVQHKEFSDAFLERFTPEILNVYMEQMERYSQGEYFTPVVRQLIINFIQYSIEFKTPWICLKPHLTAILKKFIFPQFYFTQEDAELWHSDPSEYIRRNEDPNPFEEICDPANAAQTFLIELLKCREKESFKTVLALTSEIFSSYKSSPPESRNYPEKYAAFKVMASLQLMLSKKTSPLYPQLEQFFIADVFPEFSNPHGYMRAIACVMVTSFRKIEFSLESQKFLFDKVLACLFDPEYCVKVYAAGALGTIVRFDAITESLRPEVPKIMQILLNLNSEIETDNITRVMEIFTEKFPKELAPFAVGLCKELNVALGNLLSDLPDDFMEREGPIEAAAGILSTVAGLVLSVESDRQIVSYLEEEMVPVMAEIFNSNLSEIISPLTSYLVHGREHLVQKPAYIDKIENMALSILDNEFDIYGESQMYGCVLLELLVLFLKGHIDQYVERYIKLSLDRLRSTTAMPLTPGMRAHYTELLICCVYYNPTVSLRILESLDGHLFFFDLWFKHLLNFPRVFDKKLMILTLCGLLDGPVDQFPWLQHHAHLLVNGIINTFKTYPEALKNQEEFEARYSKDYETDDEDDGEILIGGADGEYVDDEDDEDGDVDDETEYEEYLEGNRKYGHLVNNEISEDFEEDIITPLDEVDPYIEFCSFLGRVQPASVSSQVLHNLDAQQQSFLHQIMEIGKKQAQQDAEAAAAATN